MKVHAAIAAMLSAGGVRRVFGVLGGGNLLIVDDLVHEHGVTYVGAAREDGAVSMADGYGRASGQLGIATVTHGPALTNTVTALTEAARHRTPLLLIAGDTPTGVEGHLQDVDQRETVRCTGAGFQQVTSAAGALRALEQALRRARIERRPIVVNVPVDLQQAEIDAVARGPVGVREQAVAPDPAVLEQAAGALASANRPLILAGRGAVRAGAREPLLALAALLGAPVATTLLAKDYLHGAPANLGICGTFSSGPAAATIAEADCVLAAGASLNEWTTAHGTLLSRARVVQCDVDHAEIGRHRAVDVGVVGDARVVAEQLGALVGELAVPARGFAGRELQSRLAAFSPRDEFADESGDGTVDLRSFMIGLDTAVPPERTVAIDAGRFLMAPARYLRVPHPDRFIFAVSFGAVGLGLAAGIGAAMAHPDEPTVAVIGDGGLMMSMAELDTAVRHRLPLLVVVVNDGGYGAEYYHLLRASRSPELAQIARPDFAALARALGGRGIRVDSMEQLGIVGKEIGDLDGPLMLDVLIDPAVRIGFGE